MVITALITFVSTAAAIFFFVVKPANAMLARLTKPGEDVVDDEEPEQFAREARRARP